MKKSNFPIVETLAISIGEIVCAAITCLVFLIVGKGEIHYSVILGSVLGVVIMIANFLLLTVSTNFALDRAMAERENREYTEEEAAEFAKRHQTKIALISRISFIVRCATMIGALALAFLVKDGAGDNVFNLIATLVPLLTFYPLIFVTQIIIQRRKKNGQSG